MQATAINILNIGENILKLGEVREWMVQAGIYLKDRHPSLETRVQFHPGGVNAAGRVVAFYQHDVGKVKLHVRQAPGETCVAQLVVFDSAGVPLYSAVHEAGLCELSVLNWVHLAIEEQLLPSGTIP